MKQKKRWAVLALTPILSILLALNVSAVDTDYSGYLDPETGEPINTENEETGKVSLSDSMFYDWSTQEYVFPVEGTLNEVRVSCPDGMVCTTPVSINTDSASIITVYRDGVEVKDGLDHITEVGEYLLQVNKDGEKRRLMTFTIIGETTNALMNFIVPDGFYVTEAYMDGRDVYMDRFTVGMAEEGDYEITIDCMSANLTYTIKTTIDRTPPELTFDGKIDQNGRVHSALTFSGVEPGGRVYLTKDGTEITPEITGGQGTLEDSGIYVLRVYDAAGNMTEYQFTIMMYFNTNSVIFFTLVALLVAGVIAYIVIQRKRLKIG